MKRLHRGPFRHHPSFFFSILRFGCLLVMSIIPTKMIISTARAFTVRQKTMKSFLSCQRRSLFLPTSITSSSSLSVAKRRNHNDSSWGSSSSSFNDDNELYSNNKSGYSRPVIHWYPGHIAKAERQLQETLKAVDVVVEVRDARIPQATSHPHVAKWCAGKPRLVVLTHVDAIPRSSQQEWKQAYQLFGAAEHGDGVTDRQVQNQARQAEQERLKYSSSNSRQATEQKQKVKKQESASSNSLKVVSPVQDVLFVNAKLGQGMHSLTRAIFRAGAHVQTRRQRRGLQPRPLRVGILGYPNVGKSALINRLLKRKRAKTANTPGVTRSLQWIRVRSDSSSSNSGSSSNQKEFELLDSPGIIPASLVDQQSSACLLAACNCIGNAAYDNQAIAAFLCDWLLALSRQKNGCVDQAPEWRKKCRERYKFDPLLPDSDETTSSTTTTMAITGEDMLNMVADNTCQGNPEDAARKILQDFRSGRMGPICLQVAPKDTSNNDDSSRNERREQQQRQFKQEQEARARAAVETAKERGLELPPIVEQQKTTEDKDVATDTSQVGKGLFDGW